MNDDLLKQVGGGLYFDELLSRICDIRTSEKFFDNRIIQWLENIKNKDTWKEKINLVKLKNF